MTEDVFVGGYEYTMDCPECGEFSFIAKGLRSEHKRREYSRLFDDEIDKNPRSVKNGERYWCPKCDATFELSFEKVSDGDTRHND